MSAKKVNMLSNYFFITSIVLIILLFSAINLASYFKPKVTNVLGASSQETGQAFWEKFLTNNPEYLPGWAEIGRADKVLEIDPNYVIP